MYEHSSTPKRNRMNLSFKTHKSVLFLCQGNARIDHSIQSQKPLSNAVNKLFGLSVKYSRTSSLVFCTERVKTVSISTFLSTVQFKMSSFTSEFTRSHCSVCMQLLPLVS